MGGYWAIIKSVNWTHMLSYSTVKIVRVNDKRLGILHYLFLFAIFLYIVVYTLLFEKKYLLTEVPSVSYRLSLRQPDVPYPTDQLPYCYNDTNPSYQGYPTHPCAYYKDNVVVFPETEQSAMLATSRITLTDFSAPCDFTVPCEYQNVTEPVTYFVADIERFTVMIDHAIYATNLNIQRNAREMTGKLVDLNGDELQLSAPNQVGIENEYDIVEIQQLLKAAGVASLDENSGASDVPESLRYAGLILLVVITYTNQVSFNTNYITYTIQARHIDNTEFKSVQNVFSDFPSAYTEYNRHGIRIIFEAQGTVGLFDFQTLLINLIAGAALVSLTTIAVDLIALYVLPQKDVYRTYMLEDTPMLQIKLDDVASSKEDKDTTAQEEDPLLPGSDINGEVSGTTSIKDKDSGGTYYGSAAV